jgi:hypothetical protein
MSVFRVNLNNTEQGLLDRQPGTAGAIGAQFATSKQRQVYIMGPGKINRLLSDGETFTDCNYYKRYAYPQVELEQAILTVVTDDGSIYSDDSTENTYPKVYDLVCLANSQFADNQADILTDTGGHAVFVQLTNTHASADVAVRLNGVSDAVFTLEAGTTQVFNAGDLAVTLIEVANTASGILETVTVEALCSVKSVCNS